MLLIDLSVKSASSVVHRSRRLRVTAGPDGEEFLTRTVLRSSVMSEIPVDLNTEHATFVDLLRARAAKRADQRAFTFLLDGESQEAHLSYGDLDARARAVAAWLQTVASPGDRVLLLHPFGLEYIAALLRLPVRRRRPRSHLSSPRQPLLGAAQGDRCRCAGDRRADHGVGLGRFGFATGSRASLGPLHWMASETIPAATADAWRQPAIDGDTLALLQYTSGSTGTPKGVVLTHRNLLANQQSIRIAFGHTEEYVGLGWLPLYHDMGLIGKVLQPVYLGIPCILMSPVAFLQKPIRWLRAISRYRVSTSGGPNFAYELCVQATTPEQRDGLDLSCWKVAFNGAEPVRAETLERFAEAFAPYGFRPSAFYPCYGLAEATLIVSGGVRGGPPVLKTVRSSTLERTSRRARAAGREGFADPCRVRQGAARPPGDCRPSGNAPPLRPKAKWGKSGLSAPAWPKAIGASRRPAPQTFRALWPIRGEGPFLRTGDLGFSRRRRAVRHRAAEGLIIIRGRNYYPQDIEQTVQRCHPALGGCLGAAFSVEIEGEERLVVVHEVRRGHLRGLDVEEVVAAIRQAVSEELETPGRGRPAAEDVEHPQDAPAARSSVMRAAATSLTAACGRGRPSGRQRLREPRVEPSSGGDQTRLTRPSAEGEKRRGADGREHPGHGSIARMAERLGVAPEEINPRQPFARTASTRSPRCRWPSRWSVAGPAGRAHGGLRLSDRRAAGPLPRRRCAAGRAAADRRQPSQASRSP